MYHPFTAFAQKLSDHHKKEKPIKQSKKLAKMLEKQEKALLVN